MKVLIIGTFEVDGQEETGIFIRCSLDEIRETKHLFAESVQLKKAREVTDVLEGE